MPVFDQHQQQVESQYNAARDINVFSGAPRTELDRQARNRATMLKKVASFWVKGVLERSLHGAARIALGLEHKPKTVAYPWDLILQQPNTSDQVLPPGTPIREIFESWEGELLILGAPGSGKTTLLLELARDLIAHAEADPTYPMPVVFHLASWARRCRPLADWLVDELNERYDVPRQTGRTWVETDQLLPLLDGLDEVPAEHRLACVMAINAFRRDHGLGPLVVCSRTTEYEVLTTRLKLRGAVLIQPLSPQQIDAYLGSTDDHLAGLRAALEVDAELRELATSPLLLSIMTLAYQGKGVEALPASGTVEDRRAHLFATYVEQMLARRGAVTHYTRAQTTRWLSWLAQGMAQQAQSIFLLERLQPDWLPTRMARWQYALVDRLGGGIVSGLLVGLLCTVASGLQGGLVGGLVVGLVGALFGGKREVQTKARQDIWRLASLAILSGLVGGLCLGVSGLLVSALISANALSYGLSFTWLGWLVFGLAGALAGRPGTQPRYIAVAESLRWSGRKALQATLGGLAFGLVFGLVFGFVFGLAARLVYPSAGWRGLTVGLVAGLSSGLINGLIIALIGGLVTAELEVKATPNQGVRRSARNAILVGLASGLVIILVIILLGMIGPVTFPTTNANTLTLVGLSSIAGLVVGSITALAYGGQACISHFALRLVLWSSGMMPWDYVRFLDYATERIFLRKVGGGYIFVHRLVQDYFAALDIK